MFFRQLFDAASSTYTYLIATKPGGDALLIDPVKENVPQYLQLLKELNLTLLYSLDTHVHADHITGATLLAHHTGCKIVMGATTQAQGVDLLLKDGEVLNLDEIQLITLHTPGHTSDSCCFRMADRVFTGDTLLIRGTGRTDFQNGDPKQAYQSLHTKLLILPDDTLVYPAHDYKGMTVSTIGEEKQNNPRLKPQDPDTYAHLMSNLNLPYPKMMDTAVPANLHCGA